MSTYGQFCPIAKAMELLDERWTLLVVSELLRGSVHFNDLRRGAAEDVTGAVIQTAQVAVPRRCCRTQRDRRSHLLFADAVRSGTRGSRGGARRVGNSLDR